MLGGEAQTEGDENGAGDALDGAADARPAQHVAGPRDGAGVEREPGEGQQRENQAEHYQREETCAAIRGELRQEAGEEDSHLLIALIAERPVKESEATGHPAACRGATRDRCLTPA